MSADAQERAFRIDFDAAPSFLDALELDALVGGRTPIRRTSGSLRALAIRDARPLKLRRAAAPSRRRS